MLLKIGENELNLKLNIGSVKRVREKTGFDLLMKRDPKRLMEELADIEKVAEIIVVLLEPEFERLGLDADKVYDLFDGPTLKTVNDAFFTEITSFFAATGRSGAATAVTKILQTWSQAEARTVELVNETADKLEQTIKTMTLSGVTSTAVPESPESAPKNTPSGN